MVTVIVMVMVSSWYEYHDDGHGIVMVMVIW